jgi:hypothetical protein
VVQQRAPLPHGSGRPRCGPPPSLRARTTPRTEARQENGARRCFYQSPSVWCEKKNRHGGQLYEKILGQKECFLLCLLSARSAGHRAGSFSVIRCQFLLARFSTLEELDDPLMYAHWVFGEEIVTRIGNHENFGLRETAFEHLGVGRFDQNIPLAVHDQDRAFDRR